MVMGDLPEETEVLVIGGGPGGYAAAFRAASLGLKVTLASEEERLGGVCLLRGCIPSKTLLNLSELMHTAEQAEAMGIHFGKPEVDLQGLRDWKNNVIEKLSRGLASLCQSHGVKVVNGRARFVGKDSVKVDGGGSGTINFRHAIIATGSRPAVLPGLLEDGKRVLDSTSALELTDIPERLLVVGAGYVGLELGQVYASLGSRVTMLEMTDRILPGADRDLTAPLVRRLEEQFESIHLETAFGGIESGNGEAGMTANLKGKDEEFTVDCDRILVSIGRKPNTDDLGLEKAKIETDRNGFIVVDEKRQSSAPRIYAIGDAAGGMLLAHKAMHEGRVAAEVIAGEPSAFDVRAIPAVVFTDPQVAWCGLTERKAQERGRRVSATRFPWRASGRAQSIAADDGLTKLLVEPDSGRILGMGAVGRQAESLIAEGVLAIEMGATAEDLALTIHTHPTLSETVGEAAGLFLGHATHIADGHKAKN